MILLNKKKKYRKISKKLTLSTERLHWDCIITIMRKRILWDPKTILVSICTTSSLSIYLIVFSTNILFSPYRYINRSSIVSNIAVWKFILWYKWLYRNNKLDNYVLSTKRLDCPLLWSFFLFRFLYLLPL